MVTMAEWMADREKGPVPLDVRCSLVGVERHRTLTWPRGWPIPREGEAVYLRGLEPLVVRHVVWYPEGDVLDAAGDQTPNVYLVIGRKGWED